MTEPSEIPTGSSKTIATTPGDDPRTAPSAGALRSSTAWAPAGTASPENAANVMCRDLISVDPFGYVYDCDFNQMLRLPLGGGGEPRHLRDLVDDEVDGAAIAVADHCYGCTAGQGSSCGGALAS